MNEQLGVPFKYVMLSFVSPVLRVFAFRYLTAYSSILIAVMAPFIFLMPAFLGFKLWKHGSIASRLLSVLNVMWGVFMALPSQYKDAIL